MKKIIATQQVLFNDVDEFHFYGTQKLPGTNENVHVLRHSKTEETIYVRVQLLALNKHVLWAKYNESNIDYVIKFFDLTHPRNREFFYNERDIMKRFGHLKGFIQPLRVFQYSRINSEEKLLHYGAILMPNLNDSPSMTSFQKLKFLSQVLRPIKILHEAGYAHNDIKKGNVLNSSRLGGILADYDAVKPRDVSSDRSTFVDPARCKNTRDNVDTLVDHRQSDMWQIGMLALELLGYPTTFFDNGFDANLSELDPCVLSQDCYTSVRKSIAKRLVDLDVCSKSVPNNRSIYANASYNSDVAKGIIILALSPFEKTGRININKAERDLCITNVLRLLDRHPSPYNNYTLSNPIHSWVEGGLTRILSSMTILSMSMSDRELQASQALNNIVRLCLKEKPEERPKASSLLHTINQSIRDIAVRTKQNSPAQNEQGSKHCCTVM